METILSHFNPARTHTASSLLLLLLVLLLFSFYSNSKDTWASIGTQTFSDILSLVFKFHSISGHNKAHFCEAFSIHLFQAMSLFLSQYSLQWDFNSLFMITSLHKSCTIGTFFSERLPLSLLNFPAYCYSPGLQVKYEHCLRRYVVQR
jgi:hypothetical protein